MECSRRSESRKSGEARNRIETEEHNSGDGFISPPPGEKHCNRLTTLYSASVHNTKHD